MFRWMLIVLHTGVSFPYLAALYNGVSQRDTITNPTRDVLYLHLIGNTDPTWLMVAGGEDDSYKLVEVR